MFRFGYSQFPFLFYSPDAGGAPSAPGGGGTPGGGGNGAPPAGGTPSPNPSPSSVAPGAQSQGGTPGSNGSPADQGPVDYARFNDVNTKYNQVKWAEGKDAATVEEATRLWDWFDTDPQGAYEYLTGIMRRAGHVKDTPQRQGQPRGTDKFTDPQTGRPLPDVILDNGASFYSAPQMEKFVEWKDAQTAERLAKLEGTHTQTQAKQEASQLLKEAESTWPAFSDHIEDIFKEMQRDRRLSLDGAYRRVVVQSGKLEAFHRKKMGEELRANGQAGQGGGNPQGGAPTHTTELSKLPMKELFRREMKRRGLGS